MRFGCMHSLLVCFTLYIIFVTYVHHKALIVLTYFVFLLLRTCNMRGKGNWQGTQSIPVKGACSA
jgi:hypothetical protein